MQIIKSFLLGIIQGLTEFLPVSSSGHLVIFQKILGFNTGQLTLDVFLHFGTLIPVIIIFWDDIKDIVLFKKDKHHLIYLIIVGAIPTAVIGILFKDFFTSLFESVLNTGFMLLITGILLYLAEILSKTKKEIIDFKTHNAFLVGLVQSMAIIPGISRSGATIVASLLQGLKREDAARYSFLLSIPVIFGANLLELFDVMGNGLVGLTWPVIIAGVFSSAVAGYLAIKYLLYVLRTGSLIIFSYYCWLVGFMVIIWAGLF